MGATETEKTTTLVEMCLRTLEESEQFREWVADEASAAVRRAFILAGRGGGPMDKWAGEFIDSVNDEVGIPGTWLPVDSYAEDARDSLGCCVGALVEQYPKIASYIEAVRML